MEGVVGSISNSRSYTLWKSKSRKNHKHYFHVWNVAWFESLYMGDNCEKYTNRHIMVPKAAMIQLTKYYAVLLGKYNIYVNAISPGPFPKK